MEEISFFEEDIQLPSFFNEEKLSQWLCQIAATHDKKISFINYIFCSDEYLLNINKEYLDHDYYTDIITFPYREDEVIESDIYISIDRIADNATNLNIPFQEEFNRVLAHGLLHLCGFGDKTDQDAKEMRTLEDKALRLYNI